jgi:hypothetical protein
MGYCPDHYGTPRATSVTREVGSRKQMGDGYVSVKLPDGRIIGEHRAVMESVLGRRLVPGETVHHVNGVRDDNRPENLELWFNQPYGQRVGDLVKYLVEHHRDALMEAMQ